MTDEAKAIKDLCVKCSSYDFCKKGNQLHCAETVAYIKGLVEGRKEKQGIIDTQTDEIENRDINLAKKESIIIRQQIDIQNFEKENAELSKMIDMSFMSFLPRSLEMVACSQCEYDDFGYCRINKRDNVDYKHCKERYREALLKRAELEKRVENEK